jgi:hypothetical protein
MEVNVCFIYLRVAMNNTFSKVNSENDRGVRLGEGLERIYLILCICCGVETEELDLWLLRSAGTKCIVRM